MISLPRIEDAGNLEGKRVLVRLDLNVPVIDGKIVDTYRIDQSISTIDLLRHKKAKIIIIAHSENKDNSSLHPMADYMRGFFPVEFSDKLFGAEALALVDGLTEGQVLMFENLRNDPGEKANDESFARKLAGYADIYINEAFSVSHRSHTSIVSIPKFLPHFAGPLFIKEVENLSHAFSPEHPFLFILGGAKFDTKLPLIQKFLKTADTVFVGGALANNIFKEKGYETGTSLVSEGEFGIKEILAHENLKYPTDVTVKTDDGSAMKKADELGKEDCIADCGPETLVVLQEEVNKAKFILWNGPLGNYEAGFAENTDELAKMIAERSKEGAQTIIGGGDTLASIQSLNLLHSFSFVSTGGGAMLDFLANETLPGIQVLTK